MSSLYSIGKYKQKIPKTLHQQLKEFDALTNSTDMIHNLTNLLKLSDEEYKEKEIVYSEIHDVVKKYYPNCVLEIFGLSINGFGFKNCKLDLLFLPYPEYSCDPNKPTHCLPTPDPESLLNGETPRDTLYNLKDWSHYQFLKAIIRKAKSIAKNSFIVPYESGPYLELYLKKRKFNCDIHITSKIVQFNSELLQFLEKLDSRFKPLVLTLCFWSTWIGFAKRTIFSNDFDFSNYVFTLLVIFYLQNTNPPILPSIQHLIDNAGFNRILDGSETAFSTDMSLFKNSNTQSLGELLINFFEFYWNFDFVQNIISVHYGKMLPVKTALESTNMKGFEVSTMNIQDPFILSCNVCKQEFDTPIVLFKFALYIAHDTLKNVPDKYKFSMLFNSERYQNLLDSHFAKYMEGNIKTFFIDLDYNCMSYLSRNSEFSQQLWYKRVAEILPNLLQYGLLMECVVENKENWITEGDGSKSNENSPIDLELFQSIKCTAYSCTWLSRQKRIKLEKPDESVDGEDFNASALKAEHDISMEILRLRPGIKKSTPLFFFRCECYKHKCDQISNVVVLLRPIGSSKEFDKFCDYMSKYIPDTVKKILSK